MADELPGPEERTADWWKSRPKADLNGLVDRVLDDVFAGVHRTPLEAIEPALRMAVDEAEPSARELEIVALVADGLTNAEIAGRIHLGIETVRSHIQSVRRKVGARNVAHLVAIAFRNEWL